jgi:hypothetical protein
MPRISRKAAATASPSLRLMLPENAGRGSDLPDADLTATALPVMIGQEFDGNPPRARALGCSIIHSAKGVRWFDGLGVWLFLGET